MKNNNLPFKLIQETSFEKWRADTFWTKEPETLHWILSFECYKCFYDIGANIGIYSLYAAKRFPSLLVYAFEPQLENFISLCRNIKLNNLDNIIPVFGGCGKNTTILSFKQPDDNKAGATGGYFFETLKPPHRKTPIYAIDNRPDNFLLPDYIKIDTDGEESGILKGMALLLRQQLIDSMLIEIDKNDLNSQIAFLAEHGYKVDESYDGILGHSKHRRKIEGIDVENIVFKRA